MSNEAWCWRLDCASKMGMKENFIVEGSRAARVRTKLNAWNDRIFQTSFDGGNFENYYYFSQGKQAVSDCFSGRAREKECFA